MTLRNSSLPCKAISQSRDESRSTIDVLIFDRSPDLLRKPGLTFQEGLPSVSLSSRSSFLQSIDVLLDPPPSPLQIFQSVSHLQTLKSLCFRVTPTQRMSLCVCPKPKTNTQIPCKKKNNQLKTLGRCLQGSLRQEFTGPTACELAPERLRGEGSRPPYSSVSFWSQTPRSKQRFTLRW